MAAGSNQGRTAIVNVARILTGDLDQPEIAGDTILIADGLVESIGFRGGLNVAEFGTVIDARGQTAAPGLIDTHAHVVFGDWTPRQNTLGWIESYMQGGVTSMMSASEVHLPGRPTDPVGVKALAIAAQRAYSHYRPGGVKVHAGSVILEPGLTAADFAELAAAGVWLAKMGFGAFAKNTDAEPLVRAAQANGFLVMSHTGGASIPGSSAITADDLLCLRPNIAGHANGGTTALPDADLARLVLEADFYLQISQAGNLRSALRLLGQAREAGKLKRVLISTDTPTGTGVMPLGMLRSVVEMASLGGLGAPLAWALASGNNATALRRNTGRLLPGREADLVLIDAPIGSAFADAVAGMEGGDLPGISCVLIDGEIRALKSRNTPAPRRLVTVNAGEGSV
jgi:enamidase